MSLAIKKFIESEHMYIRALSGLKLVFGPEDELTIKVVVSLGVLFATQGRLVEAERMFQRALIGRRNLGPEHLSVLDTIQCLGSLYYRQGRVAEAQQMHERALEGYERVLGPVNLRASRVYLPHWAFTYRSKQVHRGRANVEQSIVGIGDNLWTGAP